MKIVKAIKIVIRVVGHGIDKSSGKWWKQYLHL